MSLLRTKPVEMAIADTLEPEHRLRKDLGALDLTVFGVGVTIGAGLFVLTGTAAALYAGPAVALSFVIAAVACGLAALCYAELASTVPVAGSAYTFSYATLGELVRLDDRLGPHPGVLRRCRRGRRWLVGLSRHGPAGHAAADSRRHRQHHRRGDEPTGGLADPGVDGRPGGRHQAVQPDQPGRRRDQGRLPHCCSSSSASSS